LDKPILLNPSQTYYLAINSSQEVIWYSNYRDDSVDASYSFDSETGVTTRLQGNFLLEFDGECGANSDCEENDNFLPAGTDCSGGVPAAICYTSRVCDGKNIECPASVPAKDGTPCQNGGYCDDGFCSHHTSCTYRGHVFNQTASWQDGCNLCTCFLGQINCSAVGGSCGQVDNTPLVIAIIVIAIVVILFFVFGVIVGQCCKPKPDPRAVRRGTTTTTVIPNTIQEPPPRGFQQLSNNPKDNDFELQNTARASQPKPDDETSSNESTGENSSDSSTGDDETESKSTTHKRRT
jgi:hypothetical protein